MPTTRANQPALRRKVSKKKARSYDASSRKEKSDVVSKKIIDTLIELLIKNKGGDVPFALLSKRSKIPLRTIFRLFKDKDALNQATNDYLTKIISLSVTELSELDFLTFSKNTFSLYDRNDGLVTAYLFSSFGRNARELLRRRFNELLITQIEKERNLKVGDEMREKLSFAVSLVNAQLWYQLKTDFGFSGEKSGRLVEWALNLLLTDIEGSQKATLPRRQ